jgi:hypothetical protein
VDRAVIPGLAPALLECWSRIEHREEETSVESALLTAGHPKARDLVIASLKRDLPARQRDDLVVAALNRGVTLQVDVIATAMEREFSVLAWSSIAMVSADPVRAADVAARWFTEPGTDKWRPLAATSALVALPPQEFARVREGAITGARTAAQRARLAWVIARRDEAHACSALGRLDPSGDTWANTLARASLRCPGTVPALERQARGAADRDRQLASIAALGSAGATREHLAHLRDLDPLRAEAAAWSAGQFRIGAAGDALVELVRSGRDDRGVALWALARIGHHEAPPLVAARLDAPGPRPGAMARLAIAAIAAGELRLEAARPRLDQLADRKDVPEGVRACAREASARIGGADGPETFLLLPYLAFLRTGWRMKPGQSARIGALDLDERPPGAPERASAFVTMGPRTEQVRARPERPVATVECELVLYAEDLVRGPIGSAAWPPVRVTLSR